MVMSQAAVLKLTRDTLYPAWARQRDELDVFDRAIRCEDVGDMRLPARSTDEHRALRSLSPTPLLEIVVTTVAQMLFADGFRSPDASMNADGWETWQANDFDARQSAIHRAALTYGHAYVLVTPGQDASGPRSVMRGVSPRRMVALYADSAEDDWPMYALRVETSGSNRLLRVYDEEAVYFLQSNSDGTDFQFIEWRAHNAGVCPVVRYANMLDLDGRTDGEVQRLIPISERHRKTVYDRLLTQHFNSWKVRTIAGLQKPDSDAEAQKIRLRQEDLIVAEDPDTKFGTLDETALDPFLKAAQADLDDLSAVAQVPSTALSGKVANLSADAIAELRAGLSQKAAERQMSFGRSHAQAIRLALQLEGNARAASDYSARMTWQDMSPRTMSQAVDALGKAATMLDVPPEELWHLIPGLSKSDVDEWKDSLVVKRAREARAAVIARVGSTGQAAQPRA